MEATTRHDFVRGFTHRLEAYEQSGTPETELELVRFVRQWVTSARLLIDAEFRHLDDIAEKEDAAGAPPGLRPGGLRSLVLG